MVLRARNDTFSENVSFGVHGMTDCRGAPRAKIQSIKKNNVLPAREAFVFELPDLCRIKK
jgi:hypothetical protein